MPSAHPDQLTGIRAKLDRAQEHLDLLDGGIRAWAARQPWSAVHDYDPHTRMWTVEFHADPAPPRLSVIFGDAIHNMRSALDHLASSLIRLDGGQVTNSTCFPVTNTRGQWRSTVERRRLWVFRRRGSGPLKGLRRGGDPWTLIERAQPFHDGRSARSHPLFALQDLWNRDKHSALNPLTWIAAADGEQFAADIKSDRAPESCHSPIRRGQELRDGMKLLYLRFAPGPTPSVGTPQLPLTPRFGGGDGEGDIFETLAFVRRIVDDAARLAHRS